jgi:NadR type nicotinamide-nucleotide adenylyltransferase
VGACPERGEGGGPPRGEGPARRPRVVVLTGAESTGKTTLSARLAAHYTVPWGPEFVRGYADAKGAPLDATDVEPIARGQIALEDGILAAALTARARAVVLDTDLLSTAVYARHYYGDCPPWIERAVIRRRADLYLLCHPDVAWVADPQRDGPEARAVIHELFVAKLAAIGARVVDVRGDWEERERRARGMVDALLLE